MSEENKPQKITQNQLVIPTLLVLAGIEKIYDSYDFLNFKGVDTTKTKEAVLSGIEKNLSEEDLKILSGRNDRKIDQTFRNLISHKVLESKNYILINENRTMRLTEEGYEALFTHINMQLEKIGRKEIVQEESFKKSIQSGFNNGQIPLKNKVIAEIHDSIKEIIANQLENKKVSEPVVKNEEVSEPVTKVRKRIIRKI